MNFSTYRFTLDLQKHQSQMSIAAFHYDTAIKLSIGLTDGGVPYYLEDGCIAVLWGTRADGSPISHKCSIENNTRIIYEFNKETAKITGVVNCQIRLYKDGEEIITAPKFIIVVAERLVNDTDILDAEDDVFTHEQLSALDGLFVNESARAEAEKARVEAENVRDGNERLRDEKEQTRIAFENERQIEEAKRVIAETKREEAYSQVFEAIKGKADKITTPKALYATNTTGGGTYKNWSGGADANTVPVRTNNGTIKTKTPITGDDAASKEYVDNHVIPLAEKVADLESLTLSFTEETSTDYEKVVPAEVGKYALIKSIGGATERVASKNILNPQVLDTGAGGVSITYDNEGNITVTSVGANMFLVECPFEYIGTPGKYYCYVEGDEIELPYVEEYEGDEGISYWFTMRISSENTPFSKKIKVMIWKDESVTSDIYSLYDAREGTVFEPYHEPYLVNADVEKIESLGKNRLPSDVLEASSWDIHTNDSKSYYSLDFLSDGWYCVSAKMKAGYGTDTVYLYIEKSIDGGLTYDVYKSIYANNGNIGNGHLITEKGIVSTAPFWFKIDKKAGVKYRFICYSASKLQSKLDWIEYIQIEKVNLAQEPSSSYNPSIYAPATAYEPYKADAIDTIVIPEAVRSLDGYGIDGSSVDFEEDKVSLIQRKNITTFPTNSTWRVNKEFDNHISFSMNKSALSPQMKGTLDASLDCFEFEVKGWMSTLEGAEFAWYTASELGICINKSRLIPYGELVDTTSAVNAFKAWLSDNPVGIKYELAEYIVTDITHLFTEDNAIEVEGHGVLRFVNEHKLAVPSTAQYVTRKG